MSRIGKADLSHAELRRTVHGRWYIAANDGSGLEWGYFDTQAEAIAFVGRFYRRMGSLSAALRTLGCEITTRLPEEAR